VRPNTETPDAKTRAAALAAFLFLAAVACLSVALVGPPRAVPEGAPPADFSSGRAMRHVREMTRAPHPTGTAENERVRAYLLGELRALGLEPEVQTAEFVPRQTAGGFPSAAGRVHNVVARLPGAENSRALMLAAHYDSVPTGPGATDDAAGVAALLETLRALKSSGAPLKNDLILLVTDGEELGLIGARAFAEQHPWMKEVGLVLNFEGRGAGGPSMMFETSEENGLIVREMARSAPNVVANSLMYAVYKRLPNDTDMTVFKEAGAAGLNFAYADRITHYHTRLDNAEELDERSLQHHGSYALALARRFGGLDLKETRERDAVYFNLLGTVFVHYSEVWALPLAALAAVLFVALLIVGLKRRTLTFVGMAGGFLAFLVASAVAWAATTGAWRAARKFIAGGFESFPWRTPYDLTAYEIGLVLLALAVAALVYALLFRRARAADLLAGALLWWLLLLLLTAALLPLGSFMYAWPLLCALPGLALLVFKDRGRFASPLNQIVLTLCAVPAVLLFAPLVYMLFMMLGMELAGFYMILAVLVTGLAVPQLLTLLTGRGRWLVPTALALLGVGFVLFGVAGSGFDERRRKVNSVFYLLDADANRARWVSMDARTDEWTSQFISEGVNRESVAHVFPWVRPHGWQADAPTVALAAPTVEVLGDRAAGDGVRSLRLRLNSARRAPSLLAFTGPETEVRRAFVNGRPLIENGDEARHGLRLSFAAPPPEGVELLLEISDTSPLRLVVEDISYELPEVPGRAYKPRPAHMMPAPSTRSSDTTVVRRVFRLDATPGSPPPR
jgi:Peptidase family M28